MLVPAAFTRITGEAHWEILLRARAIETQCYVIYIHAKLFCFCVCTVPIDMIIHRSYSVCLPCLKLALGCKFFFFFLNCSCYYPSNVLYSKNHSRVLCKLEYSVRTFLVCMTICLISW